MSSKGLMAVEKNILKKLIDAYERKKPESSRRVIIKAEKFKAYDLNDLDKKQLFIAAVKSLHQRGYLEYTWVKYEVDNLLSQITLIDDAVPEIYSMLNRMTKSDIREMFMAELAEYRKMITTSWIRDFIDEEAAHISSKSRWSSIWPEDHKERREMVRILECLEDKQNLPLRYLSVRLFGDSKRIEKKYKGKIIAIAKNQLSLELDDEEVLEYLGIGMNPSEILFCGHVEYELGGERLTTAMDIYGTSVNKLVIEHMSDLRVYHSRVLTIENKATYYEYIKVKPDDEMVIYLGGFFGSAARQFLFKLKENPGLSFYHWSDIDLGGFRIFKYLMNVLDDQVEPKGMDAELYWKYLGRVVETDTLPDKHLEAIRSMLDLTEMTMLKDVMMEVLARKKRLEQECIDVLEIVGKR